MTYDISLEGYIHRKCMTKYSIGHVINAFLQEGLLVTNVEWHLFEEYDTSVPIVSTLISANCVKVQTVTWQHMSFWRSEYPFHLWPIHAVLFFLLFILAMMKIVDGYWNQKSFEHYRIFHIVSRRAPYTHTIILIVLWYTSWSAWAGSIIWTIQISCNSDQGWQSWHWQWNIRTMSWTIGLGEELDYRTYLCFLWPRSRWYHLFQGACLRIKRAIQRQFGWENWMQVYQKDDLVHYLTHI